MLNNVVPTLWIRNDKEFYEEIKELVSNGVNKIRINCTRYSIDEYIEIISEFKRWCGENLGYNMDLILDLPIPKRKARLFYQWSGFELHIEQGEYGYINIGNEIGKNLTCNDYGIRDRLSVGDIMIIGDNQLHLEVVELREDAIRYVCQKGGDVPYGKFITTQSVKYTEVNRLEISKYKDLIKSTSPFAIALSFVESREEICKVKELLEIEDVRIISKIETEEAVKNIVDICKCSDDIMVGRGDLFINTVPERFVKLVNCITNACDRERKACYIASGFLSSIARGMQIPSRAELTDLYYCMIKLKALVVLEYKLCNNMDSIRNVMKIIRGMKYDDF